MDHLGFQTLDIRRIQSSYLLIAANTRSLQFAFQHRADAIDLPQIIRDRRHTGGFAVCCGRRHIGSFAGFRKQADTLVDFLQAPGDPLHIIPGRHAQSLEGTGNALLEQLFQIIQGIPGPAAHVLDHTTHLINPILHFADFFLGYPAGLITDFFSFLDQGIDQPTGFLLRLAHHRPHLFAHGLGQTFFGFITHVVAPSADGRFPRIIPVFMVNCSKRN